MKHGRISLAACSLILASVILPLEPRAHSGGHASHITGHITTLLPEDHILRQGQDLLAVKDMNIFLDDVVKTLRGGRVRIELTDGSILNVGSEAELHVLQHDVKRQETTLELLYGRLLVTAVKIVRPHGKFDVRSPIAVAGVVGTKLGIRVEPEFSDVLCKEGTIRVRNTDSSIAGEVTLHAGQFTHVERGKPPSPPATASPERIQAGEDATSIPDSH